MPSYTYPTGDNINASAGLLSLLSWLNSATDLWISRLILIGFYVILVLGYYRAKQDYVGGLAISGFATFVVAFLFFVAGFLSGLDLAFAFGIMVLGVVWLLIDNQATN